MRGMGTTLVALALVGGRRAWPPSTWVTPACTCCTTASWTDHLRPQPGGGAGGRGPAVQGGGGVPSAAQHHHPSPRRRPGGAGRPVPPRGPARATASCCAATVSFGSSPTTTSPPCCAGSATPTRRPGSSSTRPSGAGATTTSRSSWSTSWIPPTEKDARPDGIRRPLARRRRASRPSLDGRSRAAATAGASAPAGPASHHPRVVGFVGLLLLVSWPGPLRGWRGTPAAAISWA